MALHPKFNEKAAKDVADTTQLPLGKTNIVIDFEPNHIWAMADAHERIGLRFDCGDAGVIYLTKETAADVVDAIQTIQQALGWVSTENQQVAEYHSLYLAGQLYAAAPRSQT